MDPRATRRCDGHTMVEVVLSAGIVSILAGGVFTLMRDAQRAFSTDVRATQARHACTSALATVAAELEQARGSTLVIDTAATDGDRIVYQVPLAVSAGTVTWGASRGKGAQKVETAGAFVELRVIHDANRHPSRRLERRVVDGAGNQVGSEEVLLDGIDAPSVQLGKGFAVARNARLLTLAARSRRSTDAQETAAGEDMVKSQQITLRLRNP